MNSTGAINYRIVIPARYASVRLPGKVLLELAGQTMLQRVWQCALDSAAESVVIATDDQRIVEVAKAFGADVQLTSSKHQSGSDRIAECGDTLGWADEQVVVNLQADEPLMPPACLDQIAGLLIDNAACEAASLYWPISDAEEVCNPNVVKVVTDTQARALFFSRAAVPFSREHEDVAVAMAAGVEWKRHLGLYAYRLAELKRFAALEPSPLEVAERLEQLRILEYGGRIAMAQACEYIPAGIDTQDDLERVQKLF